MIAPDREWHLINETLSTNHDYEVIPTSSERIKGTGL